MTETTTPWSGQREWHVANWGPWGWAETAVKLVAIVVAISAALGGGAFSIPDDHRLSYWILVAVAAGYVLAIGDRLLDREIVALGFLAANLVGHWSMVYVMGSDDWPTSLVRAFAGLMLLGDLIKIGYFVVTRQRVRNLPPTVPIAMTGTLVVAYAVAALAA
jgi:hypothetical protein